MHAHEAQPGDLRWYKSSYSGGSGSDCVEVAVLIGRVGVAVRDSKDPKGPVLTVGAATFAAFVNEARTGRLDGRV
jgi:hypothetical protein